LGRSGQLLNFDTKEALSLLNSLVIYRHILKDKVIASFIKALEDNSVDTYYEYISLLVEKAHYLGLSGNIFRQYMICTILNDENVFTLACENQQNVEGSSLYEYAKKDIRDIYLLCELYTCKLEAFTPVKSLTNAVLSEVEKLSTSKDIMKILINHYQKYGVGEMARFRMFSLNDNGILAGVNNPDSTEFDDIIGCESQKNVLMANVESFLNKKPANNILLAGSRGNGKSSCIKALANKYYSQGLRLVEIQKDQTMLLPKLVEKLAVRGKFFIIYMDDLSFEQFETQYKYLKSVLEGGAGVKPDNVLFCATSNRRNIIKESWDDRNGGGIPTASNDEIHINDAINEKMSLSDRFGLTLHFPHINQKEYLQIVTGLAVKYGVSTDLKDIHTKALQWSVEQKRMSGRTAKQFIHHILGGSK